MTKKITIPSEQIKVLHEADIVVCGGGAAGIAAAVSAARLGCEVILLERWASVGGTATHSLVNVWHTSDRTKQVIFGIVQELIDRGGKFVKRFDDFPLRRETHYFDPEGMKIVFQDLLNDAGVKTICGLFTSTSIIEDGKIKGVLVDTKTGRKAVLGKIVIDATGDGDIAAGAGIDYQLGRLEDGLVQSMTMLYKLCDIDEKKLNINRRTNAEKVVNLMKKLRDSGKFPPFGDFLTEWYLGAEDSAIEKHRILNMAPVTGNPLDEEEITKISHQARKQIYTYLEFWQKNMPGMANANIEQMGYSLGIRESRRIAGIKTLDVKMVINAKKHPDAIGHGFWAVDIHDPKGSGHTPYFDPNLIEPPPGQSYHIPLGVCINDQIPNLVTAGRCVSATHEGQASIRIQTHAMILGQGIGTAAGMALNNNIAISNVDLKSLQQQLRKNNVYIEDVPEND